MEEKQFFLSPELAYRLAAIDIGTNSIRLIVAEPLRGGNYRILDEEKESTRLGEKLSKTGRLDPQAIEKSLAALRRMKQIAEGFQITELKTIATCAVREAANGDEFCRRARDELGIDIEVIGAEQEALLAFASVQRAFDLTNQHVAVVDIGGGSTEIVLAFGNLVEAVYTTQLGAVRLSEVYTDTASTEGFRRTARRHRSPSAQTHQEPGLRAAHAVRLRRHVHQPGRHGHGRQGTRRHAGARLSGDAGPRCGTCSTGCARCRSRIAPACRA